MKKEETEGQKRASICFNERNQSDPITKSTLATLLGDLEHFGFFHSVGNVIIPTDELHHFSEG